jgi:hypothetical protein
LVPGAEVPLPLPPGAVVVLEVEPPGFVAVPVAVALPVVVVDPVVPLVVVEPGESVPAFEFSAGVLPERSSATATMATTASVIVPMTICFLDMRVPSATEDRGAV